MSARISFWRVAIVLAIAAFRAVTAASPASAAEIACGQTLIRLLESGPEEIGFSAREGEVVSVTVVPLLPLPGFDPRWRIADVEGHPVELSNGDQRCKGRCETAPLPRGNVFTLRVTDSGVGTGAYVVSFEAVSATANGATNGPPKPTCSRTVGDRPEGTRPIIGDEILEGTIDLPGETDTFTVVGTGGAALYVVLEPTGGLLGFAPAWTAFDARGAALGRVSATESEPLAVDGVVTILVGDPSPLATGRYELHVDVGVPSYPTTSTTTATTSTTTTLEGPTTTGVDPTSSTSTTTPPGQSTTTTTLVLGTTTTSSTAAPVTTTTTSTAPGATTTLPPIFDLETVVPGPTPPDQGMLGGALAFVGDRLLIGAPHENLGRGRVRVRDAGAVLIVDVEGAVGSPTFARVLARVVRPDTPMPGDLLGAALAPMEDGGIVVGAPAARMAYVFADAQLSDALGIPSPSSDDDGFAAAVAAPAGLVAVGAPRSEGGAGVVYLFDRVTGAPGPVLRAPSPVAGARFGAVVAASGSRVLIGAPGGPSVAGRAFLFDAATGTMQELIADAPAAGDEFGASVTFVDADLLIGAPGVLDGRGRVDRFDSETGRPTRSYAPSAPEAGARFGAALAVGDGRLVVGAPGGDGAAFVYDLDTGVPETTIEKPMPQAGDGFGIAVAIGGGRVYVGAPGDDAGTLDGGVVFVFEDAALVAVLRERLSADAFGASAAAVGSVFWAGAPDGAGGAGFLARVDPTGVVPTETVLSPDASAARFGASVAALGDLVVAGAPESSGAAGARVGAVHLLDGTGLRNTIQNPSPGEGYQFGFAVGSLGDDVLASAPFAGDADTGLVYRLDATGRLRVTYGKPAPAAGDFFGAALAGDRGQVLIGAPLDASGGPAAGAVYLFDGASAAIVHTIPNPNATADLFGAAVALGQWIVVGAPQAAGNTGPDGVVWVFDRATGALVRKLDNPRSGPDDNFGAAVALANERLLVGAPLADDRAADTGLVYLFEPTTGQLLQTFRSPPQGTFDNFGFSIAAGPMGLLIGSPGPSRVYVFDPIPASAAVRTFAAPLAVTATATCGNGLVEDAEACDDGNDIDTDDCRNDCTSGLCCTLDGGIGDPASCDDGNRCTDDTLDPVRGCQHAPNGKDGCCESDTDCGDGQCRLCVGCFVYQWDCCDTGSTCVPSNAECVGKTCVDAAYCQCEGKLDCGDEPLPDTLRAPFALACNTLRLQVSVTPDATISKPELLVARQATRSARTELRKAVRTARKLARTGAISKTCRKSVIEQVRVVRQAIPRGRKLRRCLVAGG